MADHKTVFTAEEWLALRVLVRRLEKADEADQKCLRDGLRGLGFYISDHGKEGARFGLADLQRLLDDGAVRVRG